MYKKQREEEGKVKAFDLEYASNQGDALGVNSFSRIKKADEVSREVENLVEGFFALNGIVNDDDKLAFMADISGKIFDESKKRKNEVDYNARLIQAQAILAEAQKKFDENIDANRAKLIAFIDTNMELMSTLQATDVDNIISNVKTKVEIAFEDRPQVASLDGILYQMALHNYLKTGIFSDITKIINGELARVDRNKFALGIIVIAIIQLSGSIAGIGIIIACCLQIADNELKQVGEGWDEPETLTNFIQRKVVESCAVGMNIVSTTASGVMTSAKVATQAARGVDEIVTKTAVNIATLSVNKFIEYFQAITTAYSMYKEQACLSDSQDSVSTTSSIASAASIMSNTISDAYDKIITPEELGYINHGWFFGPVVGQKLGPILQAPIDALDIISTTYSQQSQGSQGSSAYNTPQSSIELDMPGGRKSRRYKKRRSTLKRRRMKRRRTRKGKKRRHTKRR